MRTLRLREFHASSLPQGRKCVPRSKCEHLGLARARSLLHSCIHLASGAPCALNDVVISCHDRARPTPLFARCRLSSGKACDGLAFAVDAPRPLAEERVRASAAHCRLRDGRGALDAHAWLTGRSVPFVPFRRLVSPRSSCGLRRVAFSASCFLLSPAASRPPPTRAHPMARLAALAPEGLRIHRRQPGRARRPGARRSSRSCASSSPSGCRRPWGEDGKSRGLRGGTGVSGWRVTCQKLS